MFRRLLKSSLLGLIVAASLSVVAQAAHADHYGSFVINNPTSIALNYQVQWGDGSWESFSLPAGRSRYHAQELDNQGRTDVPRVRFDYIGGDDRTTFKTYRMGTYATYDPECGKNYDFGFSSNGTYIDLYVN